MVAIENKIYVFGGRTINPDGSKTTLNDLYMLNLDTLTWHRPSTAGSILVCVYEWDGEREEREEGKERGDS